MASRYWKSEHNASTDETICIIQKEKMDQNAAGILLMESIFSEKSKQLWM